MREFLVRSLTLNLTAITVMMTAMGAVAPVRSQSLRTTTPSIEISKPDNPSIAPDQNTPDRNTPDKNTSDKKASFVRMFEDIAIAPNFIPKLIELRGISGGAVETQTTSGRKSTETGDCIGFIDTVPDHKITLTKPFRSLKLQVKSSGDTILLVKGPGGIWCSDDVSDRNPEISGDWLQGTYEVWVGSYEKNASFPYLLQISE